MARLSSGSWAAEGLPPVPALRAESEEERRAIRVPEHPCRKIRIMAAALLLSPGVPSGRGLERRVQQPTGGATTGKIPATPVTAVRS
jgi:hypothetical protein